MDKRAHATFAAGCFWCTEAVFDALEGVLSVTSGYTGGEKDRPTYEEVSGGSTGHAEAVQVTYDPKKISYEDLLEVFWATHDPTTPNRQGADTGAQYRSVIFYHNEEQKRMAEASKTAAANDFAHPIVTEIVPFTTFFSAEGYHQKYYQENRQAPYCQIVITPKFQKFTERFRDKLKK
ncbi:MAG: peptide-methionine (S)-S-oxide reductase MsrA [Patescibacteria group bacterium]